MKTLAFISKKSLSIIIAFILLLLTLTFSNNMNVTAVNDSIEYKIYNASNGMYLQSYTLTPNPVQDNSRSAAVVDNRVVDFSKSGVVKIVTQKGYTMTGFVIDAHTIATAAHCIYEQSADTSTYCGDSITNIYVFNSNGSIAMNITDASTMHVPSEYICGGFTNDYDYALITVPEDLSAYAIFNLGVATNGIENSNTTISCTGFPHVVGGQRVNNKDIHTMYTGTGNIITVSDQNVLAEYNLAHNAVASGGNSGSPIYTTSTYNGQVYYTVIGIHVQEVNGGYRAVRVITDLLHFYKNNPNITY